MTVTHESSADTGDIEWWVYISTGATSKKTKARLDPESSHVVTMPMSILEHSKTAEIRKVGTTEVFRLGYKVFRLPVVTEGAGSEVVLGMGPRSELWDHFRFLSMSSKVVMLDEDHPAASIRIGSVDSTGVSPVMRCAYNSTSLCDLGGVMGHHHYTVRIFGAGMWPRVPSSLYNRALLDHAIREGLTSEPAQHSRSWFWHPPHRYDSVTRSMLSIGVVDSPRSIESIGLGGGDDRAPRDTPFALDMGPVSLFSSRDSDTSGGGALEFTSDPGEVVLGMAVLNEYIIQLDTLDRSVVLIRHDPATPASAIEGIIAITLTIAFIWRETTTRDGSMTSGSTNGAGVDKRETSARTRSIVIIQVVVLDMVVSVIILYVAVRDTLLKEAHTVAPVFTRIAIIEVLFTAFNFISLLSFIAAAVDIHSRSKTMIAIRVTALNVSSLVAIWFVFSDCHVESVPDFVTTALLLYVLYTMVRNIAIAVVRIMLHGRSAMSPFEMVCWLFFVGVLIWLNHTLLVFMFNYTSGSTIVHYYSVSRTLVYAILVFVILCTVSLTSVSVIGAAFRQHEEIRAGRATIDSHLQSAF
jgi:hypothetical protein